MTKYERLKVKCERCGHTGWSKTGLTDPMKIIKSLQKRSCSFCRVKGHLYAVDYAF